MFQNFKERVSRSCSFGHSGIFGDAMAKRLWRAKPNLECKISRFRHFFMQNFGYLCESKALFFTQKRPKYAWKMLKKSQIWVFRHIDHSRTIRIIKFGMNKFAPHMNPHVKFQNTRFCSFEEIRIWMFSEILQFLILNIFLKNLDNIFANDYQICIANPYNVYQPDSIISEGHCWIFGDATAQQL